MIVIARNCPSNFFQEIVDCFSELFSEKPAKRLNITDPSLPEPSLDESYDACLFLFLMHGHQLLDCSSFKFYFENILPTLLLLMDVSL